MTLTEQLNADVEGVEPDMPVTFAFNGRDYTGQRWPAVDAQMFADAGIIPKSDFDLLVRLAIFNGVTAPVKNDELTIEQQIYRLDKLTTSQDGVCALYSLVLRT